MLNLDKSRWGRFRFGDVVRNRNETVKDAASSGIERVIALEHLDPGEITIRRYGDVADGTTFTRRVRPGQTLFGKRRAYQRKAAYAEVDALCSGDILVFEANDAVLSTRLLPFIVHSDAFFDHALGTSAGSLSPRTSWNALAEFEVALPPRDEQERIADLLWVVEDHRGCIDAEHQALVASQTAWLRHEFANFEGERRNIDELCATVVGGVWGSDPGSSEVDVLALGPGVYASGNPELDAQGSPIRSITTRQARTRLIAENDIVLERSGGSADQLVGRVVIAGADCPRCVPTDFQRLLRPDPTLVEPEFLFWKLRSDWLSGEPRAFSRRTTNITNLSVPLYLERAMAIPPRDSQVALVRQARDFEWARNSAQAQRGALTQLRRSLVEESLGGTRDV